MARRFATVSGIDVLARAGTFSVNSEYYGLAVVVAQKWSTYLDITGSWVPER